jgi:hypothetical protein
LHLHSFEDSFPGASRVNPSDRKHISPEVVHLIWKLQKTFPLLNPVAYLERVRHGEQPTIYPARAPLESMSMTHVTLSGSIPLRWALHFWNMRLSSAEVFSMQVSDEPGPSWSRNSSMGRHPMGSGHSNVPRSCCLCTPVPSGAGENHIIFQSPWKTSICLLRKRDLFAKNGLFD